MAAKTKRAKPRTPKPHAMAYVRESGPCGVCGCEWFRPTLQFVGENGEALDEALEGEGCANLWCPMIGQFRNLVADLKTQRLMLARLAAETPQFNNPLHVYEAQQLRDKILAAVVQS